jgi:TonB-linked SusC/RagA family outer membrane protein
MRKLMFVSLLMLSALITFAQSNRVRGKVSGKSDGLSLPGVNVVIKGTSTGTTTDFEGNFEIEVQKNQSLLFSFLGYTTKKIIITDQTELNIVLESSSIGMNEVVVTALGIKREEKSLGYGVSKVDKEEISPATGGSVLSSLQGKVAGLDLGSSQGGLGTSSRVVLRGNSSISGNNQPLYIIDGIPMTNENVSDGQGVYDRKDFGSGALDINPDDVESITVLKGPNAAALYGSRAQNGAIIITTKSGTKDNQLGVELSSTTMFDVVGEQYLPKFQNKYGQGKYDNNVPTYDISTTSTSWGPEMTGQSLASWSGFEDKLVYSPQNDNVKDFFRTGVTSTNTIALSKGNENVSSRFSYTNTSSKGVLPGNDQKKHNLFLKSNLKLANWLKLDAKANYITQETEGGTWLGEATSNAVYGLFMLPRNTNLNSLKKYNHMDTPNDPLVGTQMNPYWTTKQDEMINKKDRFIGFAKLDFKINEWFKAFARVGTDYSVNTIEERYNVGHKQLSTGKWVKNDYTTQETNMDVLGMFNKTFDKLSVGVNVGASIQKLRRSTTFNQGIKAISNGFWNIQNFETKSSAYNTYEKEVQSVYSSVNLGYDNFLYLDASFRNDWSSTLPSDNRSYFYPAFSLSVIASELMELEQIDFMKFRMGYAQVGNDTDPYRLATTLQANTLINHEGQPLIDASEVPGVPNLKPERTSSFEAGFELRALNNRVFIDLNYYDQTTKNQILETPVSMASSYKKKLLNAGKVKNSGLELMLGITPVKNENFEWESTFTYANNTTEIVELYEGIDQQLLSNIEDLAGGIQIVAEKGKNGYGNIYGKALKTDGKYLLADETSFDTGSPNKKLGNFNPDALLGWMNTIKHKRFSFKFLVDARIGGEVLNGTAAILSQAGITENTLQYRESGVELSGVNSNGEAITANMNAQTYWSGLADYGEPWIVDATNVRLKELSLSYNFKLDPNSIIKGLSLAFNAYNVAFLYRAEGAKDIDPNQSWGVGNGQGYNLLNVPSASSYGFTAKLKF